MADEPDDETLDLDTMSAEELRALVLELADAAHDVLDHHDQLQVEYDQLAERAAEFESIAEEGAAEQEKLFEARARQAFNEVCDDLNIKRGLREGAFRSLDFEGDPQDIDSLREHAKAWFAERPDYSSPAVETKGQEKSTRLAKDANAGRGPSTQETVGKLYCTRQQLADPIWTDQHVKDLASGNFEIREAGML
jgi:hypothetical protein